MHARTRHGERPVRAIADTPPTRLAPATILGLAFALFALLCWVGAVAADAANPSASLSQCANDPFPSPSTDGCSGAPGENNWVNGNVNGSKANYFEGDSLPYRLVMDNLDTGVPHTVTIEWDTTKSGKHALDYLTSFDRTVATANPCLGVSGCSAASSTTFPIPADPQVTGAGVTPVAGAFRLYGGTITAVSAYSGGAGFPAGDNARSIAITFTATVANPVLAWAGHISTRADWGAGASAVAIPGSPFHTRLVDLDGAGGNQDRALSADAVIYPGSITITKDATPEGATSFPFTASPAPLAGFALVDDGTATNTKAFTGIVDFQTYDVAESVPAGWGLKGVTCTVEGGLSTEPPTTSTATVRIALQEGDNVACTYTDERQGAELVVIKEVVNDNGGTAKPGDFSMTVSGVDTSGPSTFPGAASPGTSVQLTSVGSYGVAEGAHAGYAVTYSAGCTGTIAWGETKTCTITNDDIAPMLHLRKKVVNDNGGTAVATDWTLVATAPDGTTLSGTTPVDSGKDLQAGTWTLSEKGPVGYAASKWVCDGGTQDGSEITLGVGQEATCTITNDDIAPMLHLRKTVVNDNGGTAVPADWTLTATGTDGNDVSGTAPVDSGAKLKADTWTLSEAGPKGYAASKWVCDGGSQEGADIMLAIGEEATCTITNDDIQPSLTVIKKVVNNGVDDHVPADFTLASGGVNPDPATFPGDSDGTEVALDAGAFDVSELDGPKGYAMTMDGDCSGTIAVGQHLTCTVTNTREIGTITIVKALVPSTDTGLFDLQLDGKTRAEGVGDGGTTGAITVATGSHAVAELAGTGTSLDDYESGVQCTGMADAAKAAQPVAGTSTEVLVNAGDEVVCTFTNERKGTITLVKDLAPATDPGLFDLLIDGTPAVTGVGDGGTTGPITLTAGLYTVGEQAANSGTDLALYTSSLVCTDGGDGPLVDVTGTTADLQLANGQNIVCTFTNARHGTLEVRKTLVPATNAGLFDLAIAGSGFSAAVTGVGDNGTTGAQSVAPGTYTVSETASAGTSLAGYGTTVTCLVNGTAAPAVTALAATTATIDVADTQTVVCTFTNTAVTPPTTPPVIAPAAAPAILPPPAVRGRATLRGPQGCVAPGVVRTRIAGSNVASVAFYRDGALVKRIKAHTNRYRVFVLRTLIRPDDFMMHTVMARVTFVKGATPRTKTLMHRFAQCRSSVVTG